MTKVELSQLYYLNREVEDLQKRIQELESAAASCGGRITGMPRGTGMSDIVGKCACEVADLRDLLDSKLKKCVNEFNRINNYIQSIEDSEMRMILTLRYINGLCWEQVAAGISPCASGDSVRKAHDRFLSRCQVHQI